MEKQHPVIESPFPDLPGEYTAVSLRLPTNMRIDDWIELVQRLIERDTSIR